MALHEAAPGSTTFIEPVMPPLEAWIVAVPDVYAGENNPLALICPPVASQLKDGCGAIGLPN
jgi:hypothetical protein